MWFEGIIVILMTFMMFVIVKVLFICLDCEFVDVDVVVGGFCWVGYFNGVICSELMTVFLILFMILIMTDFIGIFLLFKPLPLIPIFNDFFSLNSVIFLFLTGNIFPLISL